MGSAAARRAPPGASLPTSTTSPSTLQRRRSLPCPGGGHRRELSFFAKSHFSFSTLCSPSLSTFQSTSCTLQRRVHLAWPVAWTRGGVVKVASGYLLVFSVSDDVVSPTCRRPDSCGSQLCARCVGAVKACLSCALCVSWLHTVQSRPHPWVSEFETGTEGQVKTRGRQGCEPSGFSFLLVRGIHSSSLFCKGKVERQYRDEL